MEHSVKYRIESENVSEDARQLNNIANELARANEGIESMKSIAEFMIKLFEKAMEEKND